MEAVAVSLSSEAETSMRQSEYVEPKMNLELRCY